MNIFDVIEKYITFLIASIKFFITSEITQYFISQFPIHKIRDVAGRRIQEVCHMATPPHKELKTLLHYSKANSSR